MSEETNPTFVPVENGTLPTSNAHTNIIPDHEITNNDTGAIMSIKIVTEPKEL